MSARAMSVRGEVANVEEARERKARRTSLEGTDDDRGGGVAHEETEGNVPGGDEADGKGRLGRRARSRGGSVGRRLRRLELAAGGDCGWSRVSGQSISRILHYTCEMALTLHSPQGQSGRRTGLTLEGGRGGGGEGRDEETSETKTDLGDRVDLRSHTRTSESVSLHLRPLRYLDSTPLGGA